MTAQHKPMAEDLPETDFDRIPNGPGAAAILAAGIGAMALGIFTIFGDAFKAIGHMFIFYGPTGPLSGVTTSAVVVWLAAWYVLSKKWENETVDTARTNLWSFVLLAGGLLLTFPPFMDMLQGK